MLRRMLPRGVFPFNRQIVISNSTTGIERDKTNQPQRLFVRVSRYRFIRHNFSLNITPCRRLADGCKILTQLQFTYV